MEYFKFDYKNVDNNFTFNNYDSFITNFKSYKYYLFDLALLQHDKKSSDDYRNKAKMIILTQKLLFAFPYALIFPTFFYLRRRNFFEMKIMHKETKLVGRLMLLLLGVRIAQKALLKYEGDKVLIPVAKSGSYSI